MPFVAKYNVYETARLTRFYIVFDVQDRALVRWGSAEAIETERERRRLKRERRVSRLQPPVLMLLRPVRSRKGVVIVGSRAVGTAIVGNAGVVTAGIVAAAGLLVIFAQYPHRDPQFKRAMQEYGREASSASHAYWER